MLARLMESQIWHQLAGYGFFKSIVVTVPFNSISDGSE